MEARYLTVNNEYDTNNESMSDVPQEIIVLQPEKASLEASGAEDEENTQEGQMVQFAPSERERTIDQSPKEDVDPRKKSLAELTRKPFSRYKVRVKSAGNVQHLTRNVSGTTSSSGPRRDLQRQLVFQTGSQVSFNVPRNGQGSQESLRTPYKMQEASRAPVMIMTGGNEVNRDEKRVLYVSTPD